jgi:hypothetical protein
MEIFIILFFKLAIVRFFLGLKLSMKQGWDLEGVKILSVLGEMHRFSLRWDWAGLLSRDIWAAEIGNMLSLTVWEFGWE